MCLPDLPARKPVSSATTSKASRDSAEETTSGALREFGRYVKSVEAAAYRPKSSNLIEKQTQGIFSASGVNHEIRKTIDLETRRDLGSFFTSEKLANHLLSLVKVSHYPTICDPTCGAGDLLLATAKHLPTEPTLSATLECWGKRLMGFDLQEEFVKTTHARLVLLARSRTGDCSNIDRATVQRLLFNIHKSDALIEGKLGLVDLILLNPPFHRINAPADWQHGTGKINAAALFTQKVAQRLKIGSHILAILPEVLRTGTLYQTWRKHISTLLTPDHLESYGIFDKTTDIHIFNISAKRSTKGSDITWNLPSINQQTIGNFFTVSVGSVVPHRDPKEGPEHAFLHAKGLARWTTVKEIHERRRYRGKTFLPPFVVIRRTSRPEDVHRAVGTIISGKASIAVENHLIVCKPISGKLSCCKKLLNELKEPRFSEYLNKKITCRHLTVASIREAPTPAT